MELILNEIKYAEKIIELDKLAKKRSNILGSKPSYILQLLARYYKQVRKMKDSEIISILDSIMIRNYKDYNRVLWASKIESWVKNANRNKLYEIDFIGITKNELNIIRQLNNDNQEKLVFSMLCYAKFYNAVSVKNNSWMNVCLTDLFKTARVYSKKDYNNRLVINDVKDKFEIETIDCDTGEIIVEKWITLSKVVDNNNIKINFIDNSSTDYELKVDDFRELGYTYMKYKTNDNMYVNCKYCKVLFKNTSKKRPQEYCNKHKEYENIGDKFITCINCGEEFTVDSRNMTKCRCSKCYDLYRKNRKLETQRDRRAK